MVLNSVSGYYWSFSVMERIIGFFLCDIPINMKFSHREIVFQNFLVNDSMQTWV